MGGVEYKAVMRNAYKILAQKSQCKQPLGIPKCKINNLVKTSLLNKFYFVLKSDETYFNKLLDAEFSHVYLIWSYICFITEPIK